MIKSSVYYSQDTDQIYLITPIYVEQTESIDGELYVTSITNYQSIGYACNDGSVPVLLSPAALKCFEYIGEL